MNTLSYLRMLSVRIGWETMSLHLFPLPHPSPPTPRRGNTLLEGKWCEQTRTEAVGSNDNDVCQSGERLTRTPLITPSLTLLRCVPLTPFVFHSSVIALTCPDLFHQHLDILRRPRVLLFVVFCPFIPFHPIRALSVLCVSGTPLPLWTYSTHALKSNKQLAKPELPVFAFAKDRWKQSWIKPI